jgi:hypothetical protein
MAVIVGGFWPSYFSQLGSGTGNSMPTRHCQHVVIMVFTQLADRRITSRKCRCTVRSGSRACCCSVLIGGLFAIIDVTASNFAAGRGPVTMMFGGSFLLGLLVAVAAYVLLFYRALKYRRKVWLHSGYMLGTR